MVKSLFLLILLLATTSWSIDAVDDYAGIFSKKEISAITTLTDNISQKSGITIRFISVKGDINRTLENINSSKASRNADANLIFGSDSLIVFYGGPIVDSIFSTLFVEKIIEGAGGRVWRKDGADAALTYLLLNMAEKISQSNAITFTDILDTTGVHNNQRENRFGIYIFLFPFIIPLLISVPKFRNRKNVDNEDKQSSHFGGDLISNSRSDNFGGQEIF